MTHMAAMNQPTELLRLLDAAGWEKSLLKHPFYQDWQRGVLSRRSLQMYAAQYYRHVEAFPEYLLTLAMRSSNQLLDRVLENLEEELNPAGPHPKLWRDFANAVGLSDESLADSVPTPATKRLVKLFHQICKERPLAEAVAALYVYEAQIPEIAEKKIAGLREFYGVTDPKGLRYFTVHLEADKLHRAAWRRWLDDASERMWIDTAATVETATEALDALWGLLDSIYHAPCTVTGASL